MGYEVQGETSETIPACQALSTRRLLGVGCLRPRHDGHGEAHRQGEQAPCSHTLHGAHHRTGSRVEVVRRGPRASGSTARRGLWCCRLGGGGSRRAATTRPLSALPENALHTALPSSTSPGRTGAVPSRSCDLPGAATVQEPIAGRQGGASASAWLTPRGPDSLGLEKQRGARHRWPAAERARERGACAAWTAASGNVLRWQ
jgi:hypothetical protein